MWIALYLITAVAVAFLTWHMSHHLQSVDGPTDAARTFSAIVAGAIWPIVLVGALQVLAAHLVIRRLRPMSSAYTVPVPVTAPKAAARF